MSEFKSTLRKKNSIPREEGTRGKLTRGTNIAPLNVCNPPPSMYAIRHHQTDLRIVAADGDLRDDRPPGIPTWPLAKTLVPLTKTPERWSMCGFPDPALSVPVPSQGCMPRKPRTASTAWLSFLNWSTNFSNTSLDLPIYSQAS